MTLQIVTGTVESDGEDIYWESVTNGEGDQRPVVVLSHGAGGSHAVWYQQVPELGRSYRVVTWDSRGFGNSTNRNDAPSPEAAAGDLAAVLDHLEIERAHLVGQSMGGWHISAFAMACPSRVVSLIYADTVGGLWTPELREAFADVSSRIGLATEGPVAVGGHRAIWPGGAAKDQAHAFLYQALGSFHSPPMDRLGATLQWAVTHEEITALGVPVLFLAGTHDEIFPAPLLADSSRLIPGARYHEIPAAGHSPYFEQPQPWNDVVVTFLDTVD
ncbi:MAG: alpha/beta fold hydrolase [Acidimicrobiales bacterium]